MTSVYVVLIYLLLLLALAAVSSKLFRGTSADYFVASRSIGPFMLLMSIFGTTMTAFALVGSTGKAYQRGIGVYGLMASSSGLIHVACFFLIGIKLWALGKRYGYVTQIQFFRDRFQSNSFGYLLFPILVILVVPYLLIGVVGSYRVVGPLTSGLFPSLGGVNGAFPDWITGIIICGVVLFYIFAGGSRAAAWANTFQTLVFLAMGLLAFYLISNKLGGLAEAIRQANPEHLVRTPSQITLNGADGPFTRDVGVSHWMFFSYLFIPLSAGMFPHLFQHWLTARSSKSFRLTVIAHPLCIMILWIPCMLIGVWATGSLADMPALPDDRVGAVLSLMVTQLVADPIVVGLLSAGILAAIMSSLDSQFLCLGTMFTNDVVLHIAGKKRFTDRQTVWIARSFVLAIVGLTYILSLRSPSNIFDLAVWSFSGFAALTPLVFAALYWRRATTAGAFASVICSTVVWLYFFVQSGGHEMAIGPGILPVVVCWITGAVAMLVVSLLTPPPPKSVVDRFFLTTS